MIWNNWSSHHRNGYFWEKERLISWYVDMKRKIEMARAHKRLLRSMDSIQRMQCYVFRKTKTERKTRLPLHLFCCPTTIISCVHGLLHRIIHPLFPPYRYHLRLLSLWSIMSIIIVLWVEDIWVLIIHHLSLDMWNVTCHGYGR